MKLNRIKDQCELYELSDTQTRQLACIVRVTPAFWAWISTKSLSLGGKGSVVQFQNLS